MPIVLSATSAGVVRVSADSSNEPPVERSLVGADVRCLAVAGETVYAGTDGHGVFRSDDAGVSWSSLGLEGTAIRSLAAGGAAVLVGTREPRVHLLPGEGARWVPLARFPWWRTWWWVQPAERPFRPSYVSALAITRKTIVVGIEACGVLVSRDGGASWSGHRRRALRDCHELLVHDGTVFEAGSGGLAVSDDGGLTWSRRRAGLDRRYGWSLAVDGEVRYLTVAPYRSAHSGNARAVIVRSRGGGAWERITDELSSLPRLACASDGRVFAALGDGGLLSSNDAGESWHQLPVDLGSWSRALLAVDP